MTYEERVQSVISQIDRIYSDTSVDKSVTKEAMEKIAEHAQMNAEAIDD